MATWIIEIALKSWNIPEFWLNSHWNPHENTETYAGDFSRFLSKLGLDNTTLFRSAGLVQLPINLFISTFITQTQTYFKSLDATKCTWHTIGVLNRWTFTQPDSRSCFFPVHHQILRFCYIEDVNKWFIWVKNIKILNTKCSRILCKSLKFTMFLFYDV